MTIVIALFVVALVAVVFAASRVIARERPTTVREEAPPQPPSRRPHYEPRRPHYEPRRPRHYALPPVTIDAAPIKFVPELVPMIDRSILAALAAAGSSTAANVPRPAKLARGSIPPGYGDASDLEDDAAPDLDAETVSSHSDLDRAETSDLDDDALTRTNMPPVR